MVNIFRCFSVLLVLLHSNVYAIIVGAERPTMYLPKLSNKQVGLVVNPSSRAFDQHLVDYLVNQGITVSAIFSPEHGFRGDKGAGEKVADDKDSVSGAPIYSLYGKTRKPTAQMLQNVDILVFDIQDVGVRFYTYISTLHYVLEAASEENIPVIVLDRPNPNIRFIDGPILEPDFQSFVGMHPIPILHGMTVGELAQMIKGEDWLDNSKPINLDVVPVANYTRSMPYSLPVAPSPNLPNDQAIQLYPSLCLFEPSIMSIGRGTPFPFQVIGHDQVHLGQFAFTPISMPSSAPTPKLQDTLLMGLDLRTSEQKGLDLELLIESLRRSQALNIEFFTSPSFFDKLAGSDKLRLALLRGESEATIRAGWQAGLSEFKQLRHSYLLYSETSPNNQAHSPTTETVNSDGPPELKPYRAYR
ncbi:exo-beta-N-acetylmuramidase NamZ domain-containing protein [Alteromonas flava]|uniref:exo-beta-N-acetylmuramidase NamZ family protein n=1 Tax=Alteromonas flava TaxID=2048003 RepID=UPI001F0C28DC|nr:DUF1343 domain-containing protein [Alteromonas flava]